MPVRNVGHAHEVAGPGDVAQEVEGVGHVPPHLHPLVVIQRSLPHRQRLKFIGCQERQRLPPGPDVGRALEFLQARLVRGREHGRLVGPVHRADEPLEPGTLPGQPVLQRRQVRVVAVATVPLQPFGPLPFVTEFGRTHQEHVALLHLQQSRGVQLVRLHQHLLPHAHLAEVMQQPGITKFAELVPRKPDGCERTVIDAVHRLGQVAGHGGHPLGMPRCGGIPVLDRRHRRLHESLEQPLDRLVQLRVLERDRRLARQRTRHRHRALVERLGPPLDVVPVTEPVAPVRLAIDQLEHADGLT